MAERFRDGPIVFLETPGGGDSLALHLATTDEERERIGQRGGWEHFGIHLPDRSAGGVDAAVERVKAAGGRLLDQGEHAPGVHYAYVADLDGYAIEI
jgi:catechol 2,3-dioxygenase-like lactoylglutathione lyase family enzyme